MKPKLILGLALVLSGGLFGELQARVTISVPIVAAPEMQKCQEAKIKDVGLWDDVFRFENSDFVLLRKKDELFSYSLITDELKKLRTVPSMIDSHIIDGITWGKRQWLFCQGATTIPFAVDLSSGKKVQFEIPRDKAHDEKAPVFYAIINAGFEGGTIISILAPGSLFYYWMDLDSGKIVKFPTGWDLNYFSADQKQAVFEGLWPPNALGYRPWVVVNMATGEVTGKLPDQTKVLWSEISENRRSSTISEGNRDVNPQFIWQLRSPQTPMKLLKPQIGRGFADDKFAGLSFNGVNYPFTVPGSGNRCVAAWVQGNLAAVFLLDEGGGDNFLWVTHLGKPESLTLLATNYAFNSNFQMLGEHHCVLLNQNASLRSVPEAMVYDVKSHAEWNVFDGSPLWSEIITTFGGDVTNTDAKIRRQSYFSGSNSGIGPMVSLRLVRGFGSALYPAKVLCLCSTINITTDYAIPTIPRRSIILLTAQGNRYEIKLPKSVNDLAFDQQFWLHNSGKLIFTQLEPASKNLPRGQLHVYVADLQIGEK
jgi:hypothetical protein